MARVARLLGQTMVYVLIAVALGWFSSAPSYRHSVEDRAEIVLSFAHGGARVAPCRRLTREELAALPTAQRRPQDCPRQRVPVAVQLALDSVPLVDEMFPPGGLSGDGPAQVYRSFQVPVGQYRLSARLRDSRRADGYDWTNSAEIHLTNRQRFVVDFRPDRGGFIFGAGAANARMGGEAP